MLINIIFGIILYLLIGWKCSEFTIHKMGKIVWLIGWPLIGMISLIGKIRGEK